MTLHLRILRLQLAIVCGRSHEFASRVWRTALRHCVLSVPLTRVLLRVLVRSSSSTSQLLIVARALAVQMAEPVLQAN